jgi:hypothetical protein
MRISSSNVFHKKNTRNTLTIEQMDKLKELGLAQPMERESHRECGIGVEELLQILPSFIFVDDTIYPLTIYKNVFDVLCVAYYKRGEDFIYCVALDEVTNKELPQQTGHLVDALYETLLWVNENYPNELEEYKDKLNSYMESM